MTTTAPAPPGPAHPPPVTTAPAPSVTAGRARPIWLVVLAAPLLRLAVPESRGTFQRLDLRGTLLLGGAVFLGVWGIVHGNDDGWTSLGVTGALAAAVLLLPAYVLHARTRTYAVLPLRLFGSRGFSVANAI